MENIDNYKKNFIEKNIADNVVDLSSTNETTYRFEYIGETISDIDFTISDAIYGVFDKLDRPVIIVCDDNVEYTNQAFLKMMGFSDPSTILNEPFLKLVSRDDWNFIAENIGEILTHNSSIEMRMLNSNYKSIKMTFDTTYVEDNLHFCFILIGRPVEAKISTNTLLYDEKMGLPKFCLYEYSVQKAIDYEVHKNTSLQKNKIAVCAIAIKNFTALKNEGQLDFILQRIAEKLLLSSNKLYTIATGTKFPFWILMPDMHNDVEIEQELLNIQNLLNQPITTQQLRYDISVAIGVSVYPNEAQTAKKIISQAEMAANKAMKDKKSAIVYYGS